MNKSTSLASHDVTVGAGAVAEKEAAFAAFFAPSTPSNDAAYQPESVMEIKPALSDNAAKVKRDAVGNAFVLPSESRQAWALWQEIVEQVATALHCPPDERRNIKSQFATGDKGFMKVILSTAQIYDIPLTDSFEFWQLVRPDLHWVHVIDDRSKQALYIPFGKIAAGAHDDARDLFHGATLRLSELVPKPLGADDQG
ncbi:hypothetical protein [Deefgea salmonis]|uniref:Uncharacterized protein n=1 Tax=Deefgea salmonis TaxID=2875502 RepID=A0ABS8BMB9_9NEIS|nr:hypothetical protein [Deefgea salmonis]MCB5196856.1 hypothetical protein [Deefgea salmonis]